jgi:O-Antigen ligase
MKGLVFAAFVVLLGGLTLVAVVAGDGSLALAIVPALLLGTLYAVARLPLRYPVLVATFLALTLENPADVPAAGLWRSPLYPVGTLLLAHMNLTFPSQKWLLFSGLDVILVYLFAVALFRWLTGSRVDGTGRVASAGPMRIFALVSLGGAAWMWAWGMARGGADVASSLWQMQRVAYLPLCYFLFELALRGPRDRRALGKVVVAAACVKAALALYLRATLALPAGATTFDYVTTHADSMLFAGAFCLVVAFMMEGAGLRYALVLLLLVAGMIANHRRVVWVELAAGLALLAVMSPWTRTKRAIARVAILASPVVALYGAAGWGSTSGVFAPVAVVRSVVDSNADMSTEWRDLENYDLFITLREGPLLGTGYGHGYTEAVKLPDVSQVYSLERFIPHNSILSLWAYGGIVGFTALWSMLVVALFLAARASRHATAPLDRAAAISAAAAVVIYLVHCYGDMGLGTWTSVFMVAPAFAVGSRLAVTTGAWPGRAPSTSGRPPLVIEVSPSEEPLRALPADAFNAEVPS